jgi:hypothetical protein
VEQSCYKCGASFEEGTAFCPQCNAPQIRVAAVETAPADSIPEAIRPGSYSSRLTGTIDWSDALTAAALADLLAAVLIVLLLGAPLGLGVLAAGFFSVVFYRRRQPFVPLTPRVGAKLGALAGLLGYGLVAVSLAVGAIAFHSWEKIHQRIIEAIQQAAAHSPDPQARQVVEFFQTPAGFALFLVMTLAAFLISSSLGGAIGGAVLRRKDTP